MKLDEKRQSQVNCESKRTECVPPSSFHLGVRHFDEARNICPLKWMDDWMDWMDGWNSESHGSGIQNEFRRQDVPSSSVPI